MWYPTCSVLIEHRYEFMSSNLTFCLDQLEAVTCQQLQNADGSEVLYPYFETYEFLHQPVAEGQYGQSLYDNACTDSIPHMYSWQWNYDSFPLISRLGFAWLLYVTTDLKNQTNKISVQYHSRLGWANLFHNIIWMILSFFSIFSHTCTHPSAHHYLCI